MRHDPAKTERILAVSRELVLSRGVRNVSVSDIAARAHIGRGTLYLYWKTKEDLFVELVARDYVAATDEYIDALAENPGVVGPHRMLPAMVESGLRHAFVRAVQTADLDTLGLLGQHEKTRALLGVLGPGRMSAALLPIWRRHGFARTDWPVAEQEYVIRAVNAGFYSLAVNTDAVLHPDGFDTGAVFASSVHAVLDAPGVTPAVEPAAAEARELLIGHRNAVVESLSLAHHASRSLER